MGPLPAREVQGGREDQGGDARQRGGGEQAAGGQGARGRRPGELAPAGGGQPVPRHHQPARLEPVSRFRFQHVIFIYSCSVGDKKLQIESSKIYSKVKPELRCETSITAITPEN